MEKQNQQKPMEELMHVGESTTIASSESLETLSLSRLQKECKRNKNEMEEDMISKLPDALLCQILLCLSTKDVVRTSKLSTRWRDLWRWVPQLDLDSKEFTDYNVFTNFCDKFLGFTGETYIRKLKIAIVEGEHDMSFITPWVQNVLRRKVEYLYIDCVVGDEFVEMPPSLTLCETLVDIRLEFVTINKFESVSLPRLKIMHLTGVDFPDESAAETLISSCPILEELTWYRNLVDNVNVLRVISRSLKSFSLDFDEYDCCEEEWGLVIDAPSLEYFRCHDLHSTRFDIINVGPSAKVDINVYIDVDHRLAPNDLARRSTIHNFLTGFSNVGDMILWRYTLEDIHNFSKLQPLPQFGNLSSLYTTVPFSKMGMLQTFLGISPNLKSLTLELLVRDDGDSIVVAETGRLRVKSVPRCLVSSLEQIEMKLPIKGEQTEMEVIRYFIENSSLLKKLIVRLEPMFAEQACGIFKKLRRIPRCSTSCQLVLL